MPHARPSFRRPIRQTTSALALIAAAGMMHACGDDDAKQAVRTANIQFESIAIGDENFRIDDALSEYKEIEALVSEHAGSETGYNEAAAVSLAQSRIGQAAHAAQELARAEADAGRRVRVIRATLSEYLTLSAIAEAASIYDPAADLAELDRLIAIRQSDASRYSEQKSEIDNQIADLEAKVAVLRARAIAERRQAGEIKLSMIDVSAQRAAELAADAREFTLRADQFDLEADRIMGRVGQLKPTAAEISLNTTNANNQITMLEVSKDEARERARASREDASQARAAAASTRDRLAEIAGEYRGFRQGTVSRLTDQVTSLLGRAQSDLRQASGSLKNTAAATEASANEALGAAWSRRATGHADAAAIYQSLADAGVPGEFGSLAEQARSDMENALEQSRQAFANAARALRRISVRGDARDRLEQAALRLDRLGGNAPEPEFSEDFQEEDFGDDMIDESQDDVSGDDPIDDEQPEDDG